MVVRDVSVTAIPRVLGILSGLLSTIILARGLSQQEYGLYVTWLAVITFAAKTGDLSISPFTRYYLPRRSEQTYAEYVLYGLVTVSALATAVGAAVGVFLLDGPAIVVGAGAVVLLGVNRYVLAVLRGLEEFDAAASAETARTVLSVAIFAAVVVVVPTPIGALTGFATATIVSVLLAGYHLRSRLAAAFLEGIDGSLDVRETVREYGDFAPYEILNGGAKSLFSKAPIWILATMLGTSAVAYWGILWQFVSLVNRIVSPLNVVFYPKMSQADAIDGGDLSGFVLTHVKYCLVLVLPFVVGGTMLRRPLVRVLFTETYAAAADGLPAFLLAAFFLSLNSLPYFISQGRTSQRLGLGIVSGTAVSGGVAVGATFWGFHGAAVGLLAGSAISTVATYAIVLHEVDAAGATGLRIPRVAVALAGLAAATELTAGLAGGPVGLAGSIAVSGTVYCLLVLRLGVVTVGEKGRILEAAPDGDVERLLDRVIAGG